MKELLRESREILDGRLLSGEEQDVLRQMVTAMAHNGDLALIGRIVDDLGKLYGSALLANIPEMEVHLARGSLLGLSALWTRLLSYAAPPDEDLGPTTEQNVFATLTDMDT